jgi:hypothetical protein
MYFFDRCQDVFLDNVRLDDNIARNQALKENVFMMVVCVELRIPLFLVGKPGSSKSLAKTIVAESMQGNAASSQLFGTLKQVTFFFLCVKMLGQLQWVFSEHCYQMRSNQIKLTLLSLILFIIIEP